VAFEKKTTHRQQLIVSTEFFLLSRGAQKNVKKYKKRHYYITTKQVALSCNLILIAFKKTTKLNEDRTILKHIAARQKI